MKDKLEKTGHRRPYRTFRRAAIFFCFFLSVGALASIPVGISYRMAEEAAAVSTGSDSDSKESGQTEEEVPIESIALE